jgi:hypothetical protein
VILETGVLHNFEDVERLLDCVSARIEFVVLSRRS